MAYGGYGGYSPAVFGSSMPIYETPMSTGQGTMGSSMYSTPRYSAHASSGTAGSTGSGHISAGHRTPRRPRPSRPHHRRRHPRRPHRQATGPPTSAPPPPAHLRDQARNLAAPVLGPHRRAKRRGIRRRLLGTFGGFFISNGDRCDDPMRRVTRLPLSGLVAYPEERRPFVGTATFRPVSCASSRRVRRGAD